MICPNCQSENKDGAKFRNDCGFPRPAGVAAIAAASTSDATLRSIAADDGPEDAQAGESDPDFEGSASAVEPESAGNPTLPGPLDRSSIPAIDVAGECLRERQRVRLRLHRRRRGQRALPTISRRSCPVALTKSRSPVARFLGLRRMPRRCGLRAPKSREIWAIPWRCRVSRARPRPSRRSSAHLMPTRGRAARARSWPSCSYVCWPSAGRPRASRTIWSYGAARCCPTSWA